MQNFSRTSIIIAFVVSLICISNAAAIEYDFVKIADISIVPPASIYSIQPAVNSAGEVAFVEITGGYYTGISVGNGIASAESLTNGNFTFGTSNSLSKTTLNDNGFVSFLGKPVNGSGYFGIYKTNGSECSLIYEFTGTSYFTYSPTDINDLGEVAFHAPFTYILLGDGSSLGVIIDTTTNELGGIDAPVLNNSGSVVATGMFDSGMETGLFKIDRYGTVETLAVTTKANPPGLYYSFSGYTINNNGKVAFSATLGDYSNGYYIFDGTNTQTIMNSGDGLFSNAFGGSSPSLNDIDQVAFLAVEQNQSGRGIYTGNNPATDKVISVGDSLDGATVVMINMGCHALNNNGQIAFAATLSDGTAGIFRADPVEPNEIPVADAGPNQIVFDEITLDASNSDDADGEQLLFEWQIYPYDDPSGIDTYTEEIITLTGLGRGIYSAKLTVTDPKGAVDTDTLIFSAAGLKGDFDNDGDVDGDDLMDFSDAFGW